MKSYDSIISQLTAGQAYAFADMDKDNDALLVASGCYDGALIFGGTHHITT